MGKLVFAAGVLMGLLVYFYDLIMGKGEIILGPKSWTALVLAGVLVVAGIATWKK